MGNAPRNPQELTRRDAVLEALSIFAGEFSTGAHWEEKVSYLLEILGKSAQVSAVFVIEVSKESTGKHTIHTRYEWRVPDLPAFPLTAISPNYDFEDKVGKQWLNKLSNGEIFSGSMDGLPEAGAEGEPALGGWNVLAMPIFIGKEWWGAIGFIQLSTERGWSSVETNALKTSAAMLGAWLSSQRANQKLQDSEIRYYSLFENTPLFQSEQDFSKVKAHLKGIQSRHTGDLRDYLKSHPEEVDACMGNLRVNAINQHAVSFYGARSKKEFIARVNDVMRDDTRQLFIEELVAIGEGRTHFESEGINYKLNGERVYIRIFWAVLPGYEETMERVIVSIIDITEKAKVEAELRKSEELFRSIVQQSADGITLIDAEGKFLEWNKSEEGITGIQRDQVIGKYAWDVMYELAPSSMPRTPDGYAKFKERFILSLRGISRGKNPPEEHTVRHKDGRITVTQAISFPITVGDTTIVASISRNVNPYIEAVEALQKSEEALRSTLAWNHAILEALPDLIFILDDNGNFTSMMVNDPSRYFLPSDKIIGANVTEVFPTDVADTALKVIRKTLDTRFPQSFESQILMPADNQLHHFEIRVSFSSLTQVLALARDITDQKNYEQDLQDARLTLSNQVAELKVSTDALMQLTEASSMLQTSVQLEEIYTIAGQSSLSIFPGTSGALLITENIQGDLAVKAEWGKPSLTGKKFNKNICWGIRRGKHYLVNEGQKGLLCGHISSPPPSSYICVPIRAQRQTQAIGLLYVQGGENSAMISEVQVNLARSYADQLGLAYSNIQLQDSLREQAIRDPLTGLFNRYFMEESLNQELQRASRSSKRVGLIMMDLDHFKEFNSTYGHPNVDAMLREFGDLLRKKVRSGDIACRYGGDEFLLILPDSDMEIVTRRAEELRQQIQVVTVRGKGLAERHITGSFGVAVFPQHGTDVARLLEVVDVALYQSKNKGGDCVVVTGQ
jgi:diguanylate cyclase (GGDEF)-like protein/PAS domain S-box-containing protein